MASCLMINSPTNGETIESNLFKELQSFDSKNAEDYFMHTLSEEYVTKYGNWGDGSFMLETDANGEPVFNNTFVRTIENFEKPKAELRQKLINFIEGMGFQYETVDRIMSKGGSSVSGVTNFLLQTVKVIEGADPKTLAEEAATVYVEWLEQSGSPLFDSLYNDVVNFNVYKQVLEQYENEPDYDESLMRKEAITKVIADIIIKQEHNESESTVKRVTQWWNRVKTFLKDLFGVSSEQLSIFLDAADDIMSGGVTGKLNIKNYEMYDKNPPPHVEKALNTLVEINDSIELKETTIDGEKKDRYFINGQIINNRVSDIIAAENKKRFPNSQIDAKDVRYEINRQIGTLGHEDMQNIVNRFIQSTNGQEVDNVSFNLRVSPEIQNRLTVAVTKLLNDFPPNSQIFTEVMIHDANKDLAGTIDLLIVDPDGKVHIFDWKFVDAARDGVVTSHKRTNWTRQLNEYKNILERYGFTDFGMMRMIPIQTEFAEEDGKKVFKTLKVDSDVVLKEESVPSKSERTGKEVLDRLINSLNRQLAELAETRPTSERAKIQRDILLSQINKAITDIQINENLEGFLDIFDKKVKEINAQLADPDFNTAEHLNSIIEDLKYYSAHRGLRKYDVDKDGNNLGKIDELILNAQDLLDLAISKLKSHLVDSNILANSEHKLLPSTFGDKLTVLGVNKNPIFQYFNRIKTRAEDQIDKVQNAFNDKLQGLIKELQNSATTSNIYDRILEKDEKGNYTGRLIRVFSKDYWSTLKSDDTSIDWVIRNTEFKEDAKNQFEEDLKNFKEDKYSYVRKDKSGVYHPESKKRADKDIEAFRYRNDFWDNKYKRSAYRHYKDRGSSKYIQPKQSWYSDEYKSIKADPESAISQIYDMFQEVIEQARDYSTDYIGSSFIPSVEKAFIRKVIDTRSAKGIISDVADNLTRPPYERELDHNGNPIYKIPLKYTYNLKGNKSLDLGVVFSLFHHSVLQNQYLGAIENESLLLETALEVTDFLRIDAMGNIKMNEGVAEILPQGSSEQKKTIDLFRSHLNNAIYQVTDQTTNFQVGDVSLNKLVDRMMQWFSLSKIGLNPFTGFSNLFGGKIMLYSLAARTKHFDIKDVAKADVLLTTRNTNAYAAIKFFDILASNTTHKKARQLTMNKLDKLFSTDTLYAMMRAGEKVGQYSALIAYLNANTLNEDGIPVRKTDPSQTSILEMFEEVDGKIQVRGLSEEGFNTVRERSRGFTLEILGSLSERDSLAITNQLYGRAVLQFKRWMLPMGRLRFGDLAYNQNLDEFDEGRVRRVVFDLIANRSVKVASSIVAGMFTKNPNATLREVIMQNYKQHITKNPQFAKLLSEDAYIEMYMKNLKAMMTDLVMIGATVLALKGFDDDNKELNTNQRAASQIVKRMLGKGLTEITFWYDVDSFSQLLSKNVVPVIGLVDEVRDLIVESTKSLFTLGEQGEPGKKLRRMVPGLNQVDKVMNTIEGRYKYY